MLLVLETPEEEEAIRKGTVTVSELREIIERNDLNPIITIGIKSSEQSKAN